MKVSPMLSKQLSLGSLIAALLVVWLHTSSEPASKGGMGWWAYELIEYGLCPLGVPFFFVVSGLFVGIRTNGENWYRTAVGRRVFSVLLPFFLWNVIFALFCAGLNICANFVAHRSWWQNTVFAPGGTMDFIESLFLRHPFEGVTWYLRSLFIFVCLSPVLKKVLDVSKGWVLVLFFFLYALIIPGEVPHEELWIGKTLGYFFWGIFSLQGLFYFSAGLFISCNKIVINRKWCHIIAGGGIYCLLS